MPPDSPSGSRLRRSKLAWSCSEVWLRPRETNQGEVCWEPGTYNECLTPWRPLAGSHRSTPHTFPQAKKHSCRNAMNDLLLSTLTHGWKKLFESLKSQMTNLPLNLRSEGGGGKKEKEGREERVRVKQLWSYYDPYLRIVLFYILSGLLGFRCQINFLLERSTFF